MVLCLEFRTKTVSMTHQCFGYCGPVLAQCQDFLFFPKSINRLYIKLGGDTDGTAGPDWPMGYCMPYDIMLSSKS